MLHSFCPCVFLLCVVQELIDIINRDIVYGIFLRIFKKPTVLVIHQS